MATIVFPDRETERRALGFLLGRFSGRFFRSGIHIVPEAALAALNAEGIPFTVKDAHRFHVPQTLNLHDGRHPRDRNHLR